MTPINTSTTTQGCSSAAGKPTSILSFMSSSMSQPVNSTVSESLNIAQKTQKNLQHQSTICTVPQPPVSAPLIISTKTQKNPNQSINKNNLKQLKIYEYLTPASALLQIENLSRPIKAQHSPRRLVSSSLNLHDNFFLQICLIPLYLRTQSLLSPLFRPLLNGGRFLLPPSLLPFLLLQQSTSRPLFPYQIRLNQNEHQFVAQFYSTAHLQSVKTVLPGILPPCLHMTCLTLGGIP